MANIGRLVERGAYTPPAIEFPGARYQGEAATPEAWEEIRKFWEGWAEDPDPA